MLGKISLALLFCQFIRVECLYPFGRKIKYHWKIDKIHIEENKTAYGRIVVYTDIKINRVAHKFLDRYFSR